jgi:hypothetical protein
MASWQRTGLRILSPSALRAFDRGCRAEIVAQADSIDYPMGHSTFPRKKYSVGATLV